MKVVNLLEFLNNAQSLFTLNYAKCSEELVNFLDLMTEDEQFTQRIDLGIIFVDQKSFDEFTIVDGLNRILSLSLLLHAVCECYKKTTAQNEKAIRTLRKKYLPHIPKEMINIIEKCINVNTYDRYDNVLQIMNDISSINTHLDCSNNEENEEKFTWTLNTNDNYINIMLLKLGTMWEIIDDYRESLYVETKAKGYRAIRDIIKKYEKIALL